MKLPNVDRAIIPPGKLTNYLLSRSHPYGRHKAAFFNSLGFSAESRHTFAAALLKHADDHEVAAVEHTSFGTRYTIEGRLTAPDGRTPLVRVVWFVGRGEDGPLLVTAYPIRRRPS